MAIIIPSKHIYAIDNDKLLRNIVDLINYTENIISVDITLDSVYNEKINVTGMEGNYQDNLVTQNEERSYFDNEWSAICTYIKQIPIYANIKIQIPKSSNIALRKDSVFYFNVYGNIIEQKATGIVNNTRLAQNVYNSAIDSESVTLDNNTSILDTNILFQLEQIKSANTIYSYTIYNNGTINDVITVTNTHTLENIDEKKLIKYEEDNKYYTYNIELFCGVINITLGGGDTTTLISNIDIKSLDVLMKGKCITYLPTHIDISFNGQKIGLNIQQQNLSIGEGINIYKLSNNELIQSTNSPNIKLNLEKLIEKWKDGREVAQIQCGIADYYDQNGNKIIDVNTSNMSFKLHQKVIPYIYQGIGLSEKPMSLKKNGEPKVFEVIGREISYEGVPLQKITILEV